MDSNHRSSGVSKDAGLIALAIVVGAATVAYGLPDGPRYQVAAGGAGEVVRLDQRTGEVIACGGGRCRQVVTPARAAQIGPIGIEVRSDNEFESAPGNAFGQAQ